MRKVLCVCAMLLAVQSLGAQRPVKSIEDGVLDKIDLFVASLEGAGDTVVAIAPFDTSTTDLGTGGSDGNEDRQQEARTMQTEGPKLLSERFAAALAKGPFRTVQVLAAGDAVPAGAIVVEGRFVKMDPGSRAKRYFAGFGAGKSSVEVAGTVKDASGKTLATFEQRRIGTMGFGGGDSLEKLQSDARSIGEDIAKFLTKWARGEKLN